MKSFIGRFAANHAILGNGRVMALLQQYQGGRPIDRVHRLIYPNFSRESSMLGEAGIHTVVRQEGQKIRYDFYQGDGYITIDAAAYLEGTALYEVSSHRGHIAVRSTTWIPRQVDALVRSVQVRSLARGGSKLEVCPQVQLKGKCCRAGDIVISEVVNYGETFYLALSSPESIDFHWGDYSESLDGKYNHNIESQAAEEPTFREVFNPDRAKLTTCEWSYDELEPDFNMIDEDLLVFAARTGRMPNLTFLTDETHNDGSWTEPVHLVIGLGRSREEAMDNYQAVIASPDRLKSETYQESRKWLSQGLKIHDQSREVLYNTSKTLLRMYRQDDGLIVHAGYWRYHGCVWVRDSVWMAMTLAMIGHTAEAREHLRILQKLLKKREDGNICFSYNCRTGEPEDFTAENDSAGLILASVWYCYKATGDKEFLRDYRSLIKLCAELIAGSCDETGLVQASAGPWENFCPRHGREYEHHVWDSGISAFGLRCAAVMAEDLELNDDVILYRQAGEQLINAVRKHLIRDEVLCRSLESDYLDSSVLVFFSLFPLFDRSEPVMANTVAVIERGLVDPFDGGLWRYEDAIVDMGDNIPWPLCTLWLASAYLTLGRQSDALKHIQWCLDRTSDCGLVPECIFMPGLALGYPMPIPQATLIMTLLQIEGKLPCIGDNR